MGLKCGTIIVPKRKGVSTMKTINLRLSDIDERALVILQRLSTDGGKYRPDSLNRIICDALADKLANHLETMDVAEAALLREEWLENKAGL
jgi:hypothetical protein